MPADLPAFLLARLTEREQLARAATPGPWRVAGELGDRDMPDDDPTILAGEDTYVAQTSYDTLSLTTANSDADAAHIAANDPATILEDCAAQRELIELAATTLGSTPPDEAARGWDAAMTRALLLLAQPHRDHPAFHPAWSLTP